MHFGSKNPNNNTSTGIAPLDEFIERLEQEFKSAKEQNTRMNESGAGMRNDNNNTGIGNEKACVDEENVKRLFEEFTTGKKNNKSFHLKDLMKYCYFDSETPYTRNLIYENEHFSLMLLVWNTNAKRYGIIHSPVVVVIIIIIIIIVIIIVIIIIIIIITTTTTTTTTATITITITTTITTRTR